MWCETSNHSFDNGTLIEWLEWSKRRAVVRISPIRYRGLEYSNQFLRRKKRYCCCSLLFSVSRSFLGIQVKGLQSIIDEISSPDSFYFDGTGVLRRVTSSIFDDRGNVAQREAIKKQRQARFSLRQTESEARLVSSLRPKVIGSYLAYIFSLEVSGTVVSLILVSFLSTKLLYAIY